MNKKFIKKFIKGSFSTSVGQASTIVFHFLSIILLTRFMSKEDFGTYILITAFVQILKILSGLGLNLTLVKFIAKEENQDSQGIFLLIILIRGGLIAFAGLIILGVGHLILPYFDVRIVKYVNIIFLLLIVTSFREFFFYLLQGLQYFKKYAVIQTLSALSKVSFVFLLANINALTLFNLILLDIVVYSLSIFFQIIVIPLKLLLKSRPNFTLFRQVISFCIPLYLNDMLNFFSERINVFIVGFYLNPASIALLEVANKIPEGFARFFSSFIVVYFPSLSKLFAQGDKRDAEKIMNKSLVIISFSIGFLLLISIMFSKKITLLIFSEKYIAASLAFALLMIKFYFKSLSKIMGYSLVSAGHPSLPVKANAIASVLNIAGSVILIPKYGFMGAVYAVLFTSIISQIIYHLYLSRVKINILTLNYLIPFFVFAVLISIRFFIGTEFLILKFFLITTYLLVCTMVVRDIKNIYKFAFNKI